MLTFLNPSLLPRKSNSAKSANWWFGASESQSFHLQGSLRNPNHRAQNHQVTTTTQKKLLAIYWTYIFLPRCPLIPMKISSTSGWWLFKLEILTHKYFREN